MKENVPLKEQLVNEAHMAALASYLKTAHRKLNEKQFVKDATTGLDELELKARMAHVVTVCHKHLPQDFQKAVAILRKIGPKLENTFLAIFLSDYVGQYGLDFPKFSLEALRELTRYGSAEFAVRPFLMQDLAGTLKVMKSWARDENEHVRRLASEGSRPRLPWAPRLDPLVKDPRPTFQILTAMNDDPSEYVRKSVANHLNDVSKDHPELFFELVEQWDQGKKNTAWIVKKAARTLIKSGHEKAFALFGFTKEPKVKVELFIDKMQTKIGGKVELTATIESLQKRVQSMVLDYRVHYQKKNGRSAKVFKWREVELPGLAKMEIKKQQDFCQRSTRRIYSGCHTIELLINGTVVASKDVQIS